jgi:hypothetical protein
LRQRGVGHWPKVTADCTACYTETSLPPTTKIAPKGPGVRKMKLINTYEVILEGHEATEENARAFASGFVFSECEKKSQMLSYSRLVDTVNGIEIWYCYGADYYFFA